MLIVITEVELKHNRQEYIYNQEQPLMPSHVGQVIMSTTLDTAAKVKAIYGGTWEAWGAGRVPVGVNTSDTDFNAPNKTGGSKTVTLTKAQMPKHWHNLKFDNATADGNNRLMISYASGSFRTLNIKSWEWVQSSANGNIYAEVEGGDQAHQNMPPYATLYMWRRTA